jgi:hypothetical protein
MRVLLYDAQALAGRLCQRAYCGSMERATTSGARVGKDSRRPFSTLPGS